jgi:lipopolysaccharide export LptBFGC system permease protein LptF
MFTTLETYVLKKLVRTFVPTLLALAFLFFLGATFRLLKGVDLSLGQVAMALPWILPFLLPYLLPLAWVVSVTLVLGRLVADQEVLAFTSLGIPQRSLAWPAVLVAVPLSLFSLWLTTSLVPHCYQMRKEAERAVLQQFLALGEGSHLALVYEKDGWDVWVREYGPDGLSGVVVHHDLKPGEGDREGAYAAQVVAARGRIGAESRSDRIVLALEDVDITLQPPSEARYATAPIRVHLERYAQPIGQSGRRRVKAPDFATADLRREVEREAAFDVLGAAAGGILAQRQGSDLRGIEGRVEIALRAAIALAPLLLTLLCAPLTFLLRASSPLVPFAAGLAATSGLFFAPLLLGKSLAESTGHAGFVFLGAGVTGLSAAIAARRAGRT